MYIELTGERPERAAAAGPQLPGRHRHPGKPLRRTRGKLGLVAGKRGSNHRPPPLPLGGIEALSMPRLQNEWQLGSRPNAIREEHGPSWRMVAEMTRPVRAWGVYPGGQTGNPAAPGIPPS